MNGLTAIPAIHCAIACAAPGFQFCLELQLPVGSTAADARAAARSRLLAGDLAQQAAQLPWDDAECGIFGQPCDWSQALQEGDRVEMYRPLQADPRESRRNRVRAARRAAPGAGR